MSAQEILPFAYFRKKIVPFQEAQVSVASQSLQYGLTCFGGIRGHFHDGKVKVFRLYDHYIRLKESTKVLGIEVNFSWEEFSALVADLIAKNTPTQDFYIRPFFYSEDLSLGPRFKGQPFALCIYMMTLGKYFDIKGGLRLMISSWRKFSDAAMPTKAKAGGCYLNSALAKTEAVFAGYDDALMMDEQGAIVEASVANIFLVRRGELFMPETGYGLLEGITRRTVLSLLADESIFVRAERIDRSMIYTADELFLTGTAAQVTPVASVDGRMIGENGEVGYYSKMLENKFKEVIEGHHRFSKDWLTVY